MSMTMIVILVLFTVLMAVWGLQNAGVIQGDKFQSWMAWFACLLLGIVVFLVGTGAFGLR